MNKKVRSSRPKTVHDMTRQDRSARIRQLQRHSNDLSEEIQRLECTIAAAPHAMHQRRLASVNTLPPLHYYAKPLQPSARRVPLQKQRAAKRHRLGLIIELALVMTALAAALGWMRQWMHF